ncbi:MAG TPA: SIS domain-containing protein [Candidatus Acetothermia bacterium]|nr:SIS domain-containing protein [Candidatus Acetothermia bacterium]
MANLSEADIEHQIRDSLTVKQRILADRALISAILAAGQACIRAYRNERRILLAGNGGSAADAQHIAAELVSRYAYDRPGIPAMALTTDTSMLTAISNDYGYETVFSRQVQANAVTGDVFVGISTSGCSLNVLNALREARNRGITTIGLTGTPSGSMRDLCDYCIAIPSDSTPRIQESHIMVGHIICSAIEQALFPQEG